MERRTRSALLWVALAVPVVSVDRLGLNEPRSAAAQLIGLAVLAGAVAVSRTRPLLAFLLSAVLGLATAPSLFTLSFGPALAVLALLLGRRADRASTALLAFAGIAVVGTAKIAARDVDPVVEWLVLMATLLFGAVFPWLAGRYWRQGRELAAAGWARADQLEREQRIVADRARLRERARIAQDMHDSLGHELSLIAVRAGALQVAPDLPEPHRAAAADLRAAASQATDRLHAIIGLLRDEDDEQAPLAPTGETIAALVARAAESGLDVTYLDGEGAGDGAAPGDPRRQDEADVDTAASAAVGTGGSAVDDMADCADGSTAGSATDDAAGSAVDDTLDDAAGSAVGDAADDTLGSTVDDAAGSAVGDAADDTLDDETGSAVNDAADDTLDDETGSAIDDAADDTLGSALDDATGSTVDDTSDSTVEDATDDAASSATDDTVDCAIGDTSGSTVDDATDDMANSATDSTVDGTVDSATDSTVVDRTVHRVVQEALTNAAKHAPGAPVTVAVTRDTSAGKATATKATAGKPTVTTVTVTNGRPGTGSSRAPGELSGGGSGLRSLRTRVTDLGGTLDAGPHGHGFRVTARLPAGRSAPVPPPPPPGGRFADARHRTALAFGIAVTTGVLLIGGTFAWYAYSRTHSVLDPADYARLRIGETRAEADRVLPDRTVADPPLERAPTPPPAGADCAYYRASGELFTAVTHFRLCFAENGRLVDKAVIPTASDADRNAEAPVGDQQEK
ncbi:histidine kinase [Streptomyces sp. NPDC050732]|uniref:histidine kinase n=1 Tax=Streptomyces sp. NPDC050732 TaxID=3154632 RepID=UPI00342CF87E